MKYGSTSKNFRDHFAQMSRQFHSLSALNTLNDLVQLMCEMVSAECFFSEMFKSVEAGHLWADNSFKQSLIESRNDYPDGYPDALNQLTWLYLREVFKADPFTDFLGPLHQVVSGSRTLDQYFTPPSVAELMAQVNSSINYERADGSDDITIADYSCGAGGLLLAQLQQILKVGGPDAISRTKIIANDLDKNISKYAVVQIMLSSALKKLPIRQLCCTSYDALTGFSNQDVNLGLTYNFSAYSAMEREEIRLRSLSRSSSKA
jgi:hypothetical protein